MPEKIFATQRSYAPPRNSPFQGFAI